MARAAGVEVVVSAGDTYNVVAAADLALVASGTATVECAVLGTPMVVLYRMSRMTYAIASRLVAVDFIAMPNVLLGHEAVPELIQDEVTVERVAAEARALLGDATRRRHMREELAGIGRTLIREGAAEAAADLVLETLP